MSMMDTEMNSPEELNQRASDPALFEEYKQVTEQFRALTEIRFKLLGLLPLATVATLFLPDNSQTLAHPAVAMFALIVTVCIATYNGRNDQHYDELVARAAQIERSLGLTHGTFTQRPTSWLKFGPIPVEHRWPVGLVYASTVALWAYVFVDASLNAADKHPYVQLPEWLLPLAPLLAALMVFAIWATLRRVTKNRRKGIKESIISLRGSFDKLMAEQATVETLAEAIDEQKRWLGCEKNDALRRLKYHWETSPPNASEDDLTRASLVLAAVVDLPARWIHDIWTGRR